MGRNPLEKEITDLFNKLFKIAAAFFIPFFKQLFRFMGTFVMWLVRKRKDNDGRENIYTLFKKRK